MAVKKDPSKAEPKSEASEAAAPLEEEPLPTQEELETLEQKIADNTQELTNISNALAQSMVISSIMSANCPPNSEIIEKINMSNEAIAACVDEAAKIGALLNYVKEELKNFNAK